MGFFQHLTDRFAYALGSSEAAGRLDLHTATKDIRSRWAQYAGRKGIRTPNIAQFCQFLSVTYGLDMDQDDIRRIFGGSGSQVTFDMNVMAPRLANILIDHGVIEITREQ